MNGFAKYLKSMRAAKGSEYTHTSIGSPRGAFYISGEDTDEFTKNYTAAVIGGEALSMTEKHRDVSPVIIDIDFRFKVTETKRLYTEKNIKDIVKIYADGIREFVDAPERFDMSVFEKPAPRVVKGVVKDGVHIIVPSIVTAPDVQYAIREHVMEAVGKALADLPLINDITDVVDEAIIHKNGWFMYGSGKPGDTVYKHTMNYTCDEIRKTITSVPIDEDVTKLIGEFSIRNKYIPSPIKEGMKDVIAKYNKPKAPRDTDSVASSASSTSAANNTIDYSRLKTIIEGLGIKRAEGYNDWYKGMMGIMRVSTSNEWGESKMTMLCDAFSKLCPDKYDSDGVCNFIENNRQGIHMDGINLGTIIRWLMEDNRELYNKLFKTDNDEDEHEYAAWYSTDTYQDWKVQFEVNVRYLFALKQYVYHNKIKNTMTYHCRRSIVDAYRSTSPRITVEIGEKRVRKNALDVWLEDPARATGEDVVFDPSRKIDGDNNYNTFAGFPYENKGDPTKGDTAPFLKHIRAMCGDDEPSYQFALAWVAQILQNPDKLSCVAWMIYSKEEGTGKNTLVAMLADLIGYYSFVAADDKMFNEFTSYWHCKLLVNLDEPKAHAMKGNHNLLKTYITSKVRTLNRKGLPIIDNVPNYARYIITTNDVNCMQIDNNSRRYFLTRASNRYAQDIVYFNDLIEVYWVNEDNRRAVYDMFMSMDISKANFMTKPDNPMYAELGEANKPIEEMFCDWMVEARREMTGMRIKAASLYAVFRVFCESVGFKGVPTMCSWGIKMGTLVPSGRVSKVRSDGVYYTVNLTAAEEATPPVCLIVDHEEDPLESRA